MSEIGEKNVLGSYYNSDLGWMPCAWNLFGEYLPGKKTSLDVINESEEKEAA